MIMTEKQIQFLLLRNKVKTLKLLNLLKKKQIKKSKIHSIFNNISKFKYVFKNNIYRFISF